MSGGNQQVLLYHLKEYQSAYRNDKKDKQKMELTEILYWARVVKRDLEREVEK